MKLTVLGTSSGAPTKERNVSSYALTFDHGEIWLFDCGEGVQYQLMKDECTLKTSKVSSIFITHLHGDHVFGLFGLLATISLRGRESPVRIIGPVGIQELLTTVASLTYTFFNFDISYHELEPEKCHSLKFGDIVVDVCPLAHRVPSFGYVLREPDRVGKFNAQMANEFGLKGKDIGILRTAGKLEWNGTVLEASAFYGPSRPGRRAALLGDTCDCSALYTLPCINDGYGLSLLLHEATFDSTEQARAAENGHSTAAHAGECARRCGAHVLVLSHFSSRYQWRAAVAEKAIPSPLSSSPPPPSISADAGGSDHGGKVSDVTIEDMQHEAWQAANPQPISPENPEIAVYAAREFDSYEITF